jgi:hypothetical protein
VTRSPQRLRRGRECGRVGPVRDVRRALGGWCDDGRRSLPRGVGGDGGGGTHRTMQRGVRARCTGRTTRRSTRARCTCSDERWGARRTADWL